MRGRAIAYRVGLGDSDSDASFGQQLATGAVGGTLIGVTTAQKTGSAVLGGVAATLMAIAPFTGPAAPFLAAAAALIAPIAAMFHGCGASCTQATQYADQAAQALDKLKQQYFAQPVRYKYAQAAALSYIDQVFGWLQQSCSNPALGAAGQRCISERLVRGGTAPWCPTHTGCDWVTAYRDPIANDTGVVPDPPSSDSLSSLLGGSSSIGGVPVSDLIVPAVLLALVMAL